MVFYAYARVRIQRQDEIAMGPGKASLLEAIESTGSISAAARQLEMSYRRAWLLVETMNRCFGENLVESARGGQRGGGAKVTPRGRTVLAAFRQLDAEVAEVLARHLERFEALAHGQGLTNVSTPGRSGVVS